MKLIILITIIFLLGCASENTKSEVDKLYLNDVEIGKKYLPQKEDILEDYRSLFGVDFCDDYKIYSNPEVYTIETKKGVIVNVTFFTKKYKDIDGLSVGDNYLKIKNINEYTKTEENEFGEESKKIYFYKKKNTKINGFIEYKVNDKKIIESINIHDLKYKECYGD